MTEEVDKAPKPGPVPRIAVVVPCYNEQDALPLSLGRLVEVLERMEGDSLIAADSYVLCVDDGSTDSTWGVIIRANAADPRIRGVSLAHNRGHQYALLAGLMAVADDSDAAISIDADLQDDPAAMVEMVKKFRQGAEIVYGVRGSRTSDTWFKRTTAHAFYRFQERMGLDTVYDHADYRLMSARAIRLLSEYGEDNLFLRGIIPMIGLETAIVKYDRAQRVAGESKYPLTKMLSFSVDGITSFSSRPLRLIFFVGLALLILDVAMALYVFSAYFGHDAIPGWTSLMISTWFLGSLILMALGVVGEYIGKIFMEVKRRPRYAVRDRVGFASSTRK
ncbi:MAG: glycosyltransferase family 2 protein [Pseudoflavonifractor sp.]|nr:glycosyltransferase family 2 protein [Alloprevotella sp.]MCM1116271.1 glycosyltransferase family 2 protein [Pseudoflavonifractor sp.]